MVCWTREHIPFSRAEKGRRNRRARISWAPPRTFLFQRRNLRKKIPDNCNASHQPSRFALASCVTKLKARRLYLVDVSGRRRMSERASLNPKRGKTGKRGKTDYYYYYYSCAITHTPEEWFRTRTSRNLPRDRAERRRHANGSLCPRVKLHAATRTERARKRELPVEERRGDKLSQHNRRK